MNVLGIGEVIWDVFPEQEILGGAPLNFCINLQRLGNDSALLTAVGDDPRGQRALQEIQKRGVATEFVECAAGASTGVAIISTDEAGEPHFQIPRPAAFDKITLSQDKLQRLRNLNFDWLYFGTLAQTESAVEAITKQLAGLSARIRCFYDVNLRTGHWNLPLIHRLSELASILKLNEDEARLLARLDGVPESEFSLESFCRRFCAAHGIEIVCVTLGGKGCFIYEAGNAFRVAGHAVKVHDTVGAGDAFAAGFLHGYESGWPMVKVARFANALGALVASRPGATPDWSVEECEAMLARMPEA